ncbi:G-protein coupled receptor Mth2 [Araneus ventricosus]|uniref:G-protein coupled receptor Mth2 n=1 Tax=Araneus ventricosus TaxID=182803 RepID=A0A4Y2LGN5_ARAVE|nr:G-protein coupled receptor Mth2 [Araneus ventricosus]
MGGIPMPTCCIVILFTLCYLRIAMASVSFNFTEIEKFAKRCPELDSCVKESSRWYPLNMRNCVCDKRCLEYGDCCIDVPGLIARTGSSGHGCFEMNHLLKKGMGVYMKGSCPPSYDGPEEIRTLCESNAVLEVSPDPLGSVPATNKVTGMTFKNYYCSICNGQVGNITLWPHELVCPSITKYQKVQIKDVVYQTLKYDNSSWGFYLTGPNGSVHYHNCVLDPIMPIELESKIRLCKSDLVSDCPSDWEDEDTRTMCKSYMAVRFSNDKFKKDKFRNPHCAVCNGREVTDRSCHDVKGAQYILTKIERHAFSLLLDVSEAGGENVGKRKKCDPGDVWDMFFHKCRSLLCLPGYRRLDDSCVLREEPDYLVTDNGNVVTDSSSGDVPLTIQPAMEENEVKYILSEDVGNPLQNIRGETYNVSATSDDELKGNLSRDCLLIPLNDDEFIKYPNETIYVPGYDKVYESTNYRTRDGKTLVCSHFGYASDENKFSGVMGYLTLTGLGISMLSLFLHFVMFWIVPDLQNFSGKCMVSLCVALFFAYASYIIGAFTSLSESSCALVAFLKYYFFQSSFFWMAVIAYDVWRTLKMATTVLRVSSGKQLKRFIIYSLISWGMPLSLTGLLALVEFTDSFPVIYRPGFASPDCWFLKRRSLATFFFGPLVVIMLLNVILFFSSSRMILMTSQSSVKQLSQAQRRNFKLYLRLALLMGMTWIVGVVASYADFQSLWYLFCVLNTFQGVFICIAFTFSSKICKILERRAAHDVQACRVEVKYPLGFHGVRMPDEQHSPAFVDGQKALLQAVAETERLGLK